MASPFVQLAGEARYYQQSVANDTILTADWSVDSPDVVLTGKQLTATATTILAQTLEPGDFVLMCTITTTGGQTLIGETRIRVVEVIV